MKLKIFTPDGEYFSGVIKSIQVTDKISGSFGMLEGHLPVISAISDGYIHIIDNDNNEQYFSLFDGILRQKDNEIEVICAIIETGNTKEESKDHLDNLIKRRKEENKERNVELTLAENELRKQIKKSRAGHI